MSRRMCGMGKAYPSVVYYYQPGDTDGWDVKKRSGSGGGFSFNDDYLYFTAGSSTQTIWGGTAVAVDLTHISTLYFTGKVNSSGYSSFGVGTIENGTPSYVSGMSGRWTTTQTEHSIDVSDLTGEYYLLMYHNKFSTINRQASIYEVRGEK